MDKKHLSAEEFLAKVRELKEKAVIAICNQEAMADVDTEIVQFLTVHRYQILDNLDDAYQAYLDGKIY